MCTFNTIFYEKQKLPFCILVNCSNSNVEFNTTSHRTMVCNEYQLIK